MQSAAIRLVAFVLAGSLAACTHSAADAGQSCVLNSDCRAPLLCAATYCRPQCREDRDCASGETCHGVGEAAVCVPPGVAVPCAFASQCGAGRSCVDGTCRAACTTDADCPGASCAMGACSMPLVADPDAGTGCAGVRCGGRCVDLETDSEHCGACAVACADGTTCIAGACIGCDGSNPDCRLPYDDCSSPLAITATTRRMALGVPGGATDSTPSCDTAGDYFVQVSVPDHALVTVITTCTGSMSYTVPLAACSDPLVSCHDCASASVELDHTAGTFLVECTNPGTLTVDRIPLAGTATTVERWPASGALDVDVTLPAGEGVGLCGATGASHVYLVDPCDHHDETFTATLCGSDVTLAYVDSTGGINCAHAATTCTGQEIVALVQQSVAAIIVSANTPTATTAHLSTSVM